MDQRDCLTFEKAVPSDGAAVLELYRSVIGMPTCTWDEEYPGDEEIKGDTAAGTLFLLKWEGRILGAVSIAPENELDGLPFWHMTERVREIARVVISPACQGQGYASLMVEKVLEHLRAEGCPAVHLAVAAVNLPAQKVYFRQGFRPVGEWDMYGNHYLLCEKELS